jgi:hypothetical protein
MRGGLVVRSPVDSLQRQAAVLNLIVSTWILVRPSVTSRSVAAQSTATASKDNQELARLYQQDQSDRTPENEKLLGWKIVTARDKARELRAKELYANNALQTGADYYQTAMVLQHADLPEDYLLAHELCVVAIGKGEQQAKSLAAKSEDRFLMEIGRPQRFGTQFVSQNNGPFRLYAVDTGVTDELRRLMDVPSLSEAKAREARMNRKK